MTCDMCHKDKPDVEEILDPYSREINDEDVWMFLCPECYQERVDEI